MPDIGALYAQRRAALTNLLDGADDAAASARVPTCPAWTVHDVMAHVAGVCADILAGNLAGVASDPWTAAQVDARRDRPLASLLEEWQDLAPSVEAIANDFPGRSSEQLLTDLTTHEHDVRGALQLPGDRDSAAVEVGVDFVLTMFLDRSLTDQGLGALEVIVGPQTWKIGSEGQPAARLEASGWEVLRASTGRRSAKQIAALPWSGNEGAAEALLPAFTFGPFHPADHDIVE